MKIRALLTTLSLATLATAAQAQWIGAQPGVVTAAPGAAITAAFTLTASAAYNSPSGEVATYDVAAPSVVWQTVAPSAVSLTVSDSTIDIFTYAPYGNLISNSDSPIVIDVHLTVPSNAVAGTTYLGTVYEPLAGNRPSTKNVVGTIAVLVN